MINTFLYVFLLKEQHFRFALSIHLGLAIALIKYTYVQSSSEHLVITAEILFIYQITSLGSTQKDRPS